MKSHTKSHMKDHKLFWFSDGVIPLILAPQVGMVFRHYRQANRAMLGTRLMRKCRSKKIALRWGWLPNSIALSAALPLHLPAGVAPPSWAKKSVLSTSVHNLKELRKAQQNRINFIFISPIFATPSHPKATPLGRYRLANLINQAPRNMRVYALGGITSRSQIKLLAGLGICGIAGQRFLFHTNLEKLRI